MDLPIAAEDRGGRRARSQSERRAAYSCRLVCQLAASGTCRWCASHAPNMPISLCPVDRRRVAQKCGIEAQVLFKRKRIRPTRQLQRPNAAVLHQGRRAVAGAHAQKGQIPAPRKGFKMPAGVRNPVHLVKRVGKIGHARRWVVFRCGEGGRADNVWSLGNGFVAQDSKSMALALGSAAAWMESSEPE